MSSRDEKQLAALRKWLTKAAEEIQADISIKLWNGEIIPMGPNAKSDIYLEIKSPEVIRRIIFAPKLMTVFEIITDDLIDLHGGSPLEAIRRWDHMKVLNFARSMSKIQLAKTLSAFIFKSKHQQPSDSFGYKKKVASKVDKGRDDADLIKFHYDISNDFYALFLGPEMVYSTAYFDTKETSLEDAQIAKMNMICKRLDLQQGDEFFDVGCGWGGLICHAAQHYGVNAYGVTISQTQYDFAQEKIKRLGLEDKVKIELCDYRSVKGAGRFNKIAQIEMFEHVGFDNHDKHFKQMKKLLKPRGLYLHQATTRMATPKVEDFRKPTAYQKIISTFIFPGGELDYIGHTTTKLEGHGFEVLDVVSLREHYQITLETWSQRLWDNRDAAIEEIGRPKAALWLLYFALFAISFERNTVSVFQTLASKRRKGPSGLPLSRKDLYN